MYFEIEKQTLLQALKAINGIVERRQTLPVLANTLVRVSDNILSLTASDVEIEVIYKLPLASDTLMSDNEGEITVPARKFYDICKAANETIRFYINEVTTNKTEYTATSYQALIKTGKSKFKLQTLPAEDFPNTPELDNPTQFKIEQQQLKNLLYKTASSVAVNDVRYYLTGLLLEIGDNKITLVGTDGYRMAVAQHDFESTQEARVIIPRKAVLELSKLLQENDTAEVTVLFDDNHIRFELSEGLVLTSKLIDGDFPDWQSILPTNSNKKVLVETAVLKETLSRVAILANEKYKGIRIGLKANLLEISTQNAYQEEAEEVMGIEYHKEELEIDFNNKYLLDVLNVISTPMVQLAFTDENSSCLITEEENEDCKFIVMPMRI